MGWMGGWSGWVSRWFGGLMDGEVKVGKTIEIAADWARPSVLPPEPSLSLSLLMLWTGLGPRSFLFFLDKQGSASLSYDDEL